MCGRGICTETDQSPREGTNETLLQKAKIYPSIEELDAPAGTPDKVAEAYIAARVSLQTNKPGFWEAAAVMARRSIELALADCGAKGSLKNMIDKLGAEGILAKSMVDWANEVRIIGNDGAHDCVTREDAVQAVYFAEMLFTYMFKLPAMIAKRRNSKGN